MKVYLSTKKFTIIAGISCDVTYVLDKPRADKNGKAKSYCSVEKREMKSLGGEDSWFLFTDGIYPTFSCPIENVDAIKSSIVEHVKKVHKLVFGTEVDDVELVYLRRNPFEK